jgi:hypothetical protein
MRSSKPGRCSRWTAGSRRWARNTRIHGLGGTSGSPVRSRRQARVRGQATPPPASLRTAVRRPPRVCGRGPSPGVPARTSSPDLTRPKATPSDASSTASCARARAPVAPTLESRFPPEPWPICVPAGCDAESVTLWAPRGTLRVAGGPRVRDGDDGRGGARGDMTFPCPVSVLVKGNPSRSVQAAGSRGEGALSESELRSHERKRRPGSVCVRPAPRVGRSPEGARRMSKNVTRHRDP